MNKVSGITLGKRVRERVRAIWNLKRNKIKMEKRVKRYCLFFFISFKLHEIFCFFGFLWVIIHFVLEDLAMWFKIFINERKWRSKESKGYNTTRVKVEKNSIGQMTDGRKEEQKIMLQDFSGCDEKRCQTC